MPELRCTECGERLTRGRLPGTLTHVSRLVAACDLNSDHPPLPDWAALGERACTVCGEPVVWRGAAWGHIADDDAAGHAADPELPAF